jgi:hypothetical protein
VDVHERGQEITPEHIAAVTSGYLPNQLSSIQRRVLNLNQIVAAKSTSPGSHGNGGSSGSGRKGSSGGESFISAGGLGRRRHSTGGGGGGGGGAEEEDAAATLDEDDLRARVDTGTAGRLTELTISDKEPATQFDQLGLADREKVQHLNRISLTAMLDSVVKGSFKFGKPYKRKKKKKKDVTVFKTDLIDL